MPLAPVEIKCSQCKEDFFAHMWDVKKYGVDITCNSCRGLPERPDNSLSHDEWVQFIKDQK